VVVLVVVQWVFVVRLGLLLGVWVGSLSCVDEGRIEAEAEEEEERVLWGYGLG